MTREVIYCFEEDDEQKAATIMSERQIRRLPVLAKDKRLRRNCHSGRYGGSLDPPGRGR